MEKQTNDLLNILDLSSEHIFSISISVNEKHKWFDKQLMIIDSFLPTPFSYGQLLHLFLVML